MLSLESQRVFQVCFCFVLLYNKSLNDWSLGVNIPQFQNCTLCEKDLKDNKDNSLHLGQKYARIFVFGHYLFLVAHSFPRASFSENCSLLGTDNVRGQISEHIFVPNGGYCLCTETKRLNYLVSVRPECNLATRFLANIIDVFIKCQFVFDG